jgi:hypothetical protein
MKNQPFEIRFAFKDALYVLVNSNDSDESFKQALNNVPVNEIEGFKTTAMAEYPGNPEEWIILSHYSPALMYYSDNQRHRCNRIEKNNNYITCIRSVKNIKYKKGRAYKISEYPANNIYLTFISSQSSRKAFDRKEFDRRVINLKFEPHPGLDPSYIDISNSEKYREKIQKVFYENSTALYDAYNKYLKNHPDYKNQAVFEIRLDHNGKVIDVTDHITSSTRDDFTHDIASLIASFDFNITNTDNKNMLLLYPIDFIGK